MLIIHVGAFAVITVMAEDLETCGITLLAQPAIKTLTSGLPCFTPSGAVVIYMIEDEQGDVSLTTMLTDFAVSGHRFTLCLGIISPLLRVEMFTVLGPTDPLPGVDVFAVFGEMCLSAFWIFVWHDLPLHVPEVAGAGRGTIPLPPSARRSPYNLRSVVLTQALSQKKEAPFRGLPGRFRRWFRARRTSRPSRSKRSFRPGNMRLPVRRCASSCRRGDG